MTPGFKIYNDINFCPICGCVLYVNLGSGNKSCSRDGEFVVIELKGVVTVEFKPYQL